MYIDTHYNKSNPEEAAAFKRESEKLWRISMNKKPFECLTRKDVQDNLKKEKQDLVAMRRKCRLTQKHNQEMEVKIKSQDKQIQAQMFVMNNLRNGIDYLKEHCSRDRTDGTTFFVALTPLLFDSIQAQMSFLGANGPSGRLGLHVPRLAVEAMSSACEKSFQAWALVMDPPKKSPFVTTKSAP